jgi:putative glutamine amidotransferase
MTSTPIIGLVADRKLVTTGPWIEVPNDAIPHSYVAAIEQAGGSPILIPSSASNLTNVDRLLDAIDGLLLPGGSDVDSDLYDQKPHEQNDQPLRIRDELEIALARRAVERGMPVYGVCRGMQVLNVALGGTLEQHLADRLDMTPHRDVVGTYVAHDILPVPGTRLADTLGTNGVSVASHHHQAVDLVGRGLIPSAWASDGVVEAVEMPGDQFILGVQWHPEQDLLGGGQQLFEAFVRAAAGQ